MKESPNEKRIHDLMRAGGLTLDGMLGRDRRSLAEIVGEDQSTCNKLGVTHREIAQRLREVTNAARPGLGTTVVVEDVYEVRVEEVRGALPCPFDHPGAYPKRITLLKHRETGEEIQWTALGVHMIEEHGFYQGRGARFRVDPMKAIRVLNFPPRCEV